MNPNISQQDSAYPAPSSSSCAEPQDLSAEVRARLKKDPNGLIAAIAQQFDTREVLMLAWMNEEALTRTLIEGRAVYWSRSRQEFWRKGDTSGHYQIVHDVQLDCDGDAILLLVDQVGAACHNGTRTCFHSIVNGSGAG